MLGRVTVKLSALVPHVTKCDGKFALVEADIPGAGPMAAAQAHQYISPGFEAPGTLAALVIVVSQPTLGGTVKDLGHAVGTAAAMGAFTATMILAPPA